jgi:hypothetical protein
MYTTDVHSPVFLALVLKGIVIVDKKKIRLRNASEPRIARFTSARADPSDIATRML